MGLKLGHSKEYFLYVGNKQPGNSVGLTAMDGNCIVGGLALDASARRCIPQHVGVAAHMTHGVLKRRVIHIQ